MMKSYLRYEPSRSFGLISSPQCNSVLYDFSGNLAISGALQDVIVWNLRQTAPIATLSYENQNYPYHGIGNVTTLVRSPDKVTVGAGYQTGEVILFNYINKTTTATLRGHKNAVVSLVYDKSGTLLASGGADSDIYIWDTVSLSGKSRLKGHKDAITGLVFVEPQETTTSFSPSYLVSSSKDTLLKVWDLNTNYCLQTIVGHRCEIWCLSWAYVPDLETNDSHMIMMTGSSDDLIRGYKVKEPIRQENQANHKIDENKTDDVEVLEYIGCQKLKGGEKCTGLALNVENSVMVALSGTSGKSLELFTIRDKSGLKKKVKRRIKRQKEKSGQGDSEQDEQDVLDTGISYQLSDLIESSSSVKSTYKVKSLSFSPSKSKDGSHKVLVATASNTLEVYRVLSVDPVSLEDRNVLTKQSVLELHGHRSDVRSLCISSDCQTIASCSAEGVKIWSAKTFSCLRSCPAGYGVSVAFVTGNRYIVVGTKDGSLQLIDAASGEITVDIENAHNGAIWSLAMHPVDGKGFMTGGADKLVKFWDFSVEKGTLGMSLARQLQMTHDVLCVRYSPVLKGKTEEKVLVAIGLMDHTIKVFYEDSLKFFLSLYGHKLPVMCLDISYDSNLLVSGSADKTIKIWGLDFGDCHRSLIAHEDSVTSIRFQPKTHYFFSSGKDGVVKYWDADRFEQVLYLPGHSSSVWALDISPDASCCVTGGQDRSLRVWSRSEDLVFVEEEKERAMEAEADQSMEKRTQHDALHAVGSEEVAVASLPSIESLKSGERIMEAVELVESELLRLLDSAEDPEKGRSQLLRGMHPLQYLLWTLKVGVKSSDLEMALLALPFHLVRKLLYLLLMLCRHFRTETEVCARCVVFLLRCHQVRLVASSNETADSPALPSIPLSELLASLQAELRTAISSYRDVIGTNLAAVRYSLRRMESKRSAHHIEDTEDRPLLPDPSTTKKKKKRKKKASHSNGE